jgi:hypothetical protein
MGLLACGGKGKKGSDGCHFSAYAIVLGRWMVTLSTLALFFSPSIMMVLGGADFQSSSTFLAIAFLIFVVIDSSPVPPSIPPLCGLRMSIVKWMCGFHHNNQSERSSWGWFFGLALKNECECCEASSRASGGRWGPHPQHDSCQYVS